MGIKQLYKMIKQHAPQAMTDHSLSEFKGSKVVIDFSLYVHRFNSVQGHSFTGLFHQINLLKENEITPIYVFDGEYPEEKKSTMEERKKIIKANKTKFENLQKQKSSKAELFKAKNRAFRIDDKEVKFCQKLFDLLGVPWIQAKGEADILMANMVASGKADAALTEDADLLAFGCPILWRKFKKGNIQVISLEKVLQGFNLNLDKFRQFCILSGCDYIDTIKGIGPKTALKILNQDENIDTLINNKNLSDYNWQEVIDIFNSVESTRKKKFVISKTNVKKLIPFLRKNTELSEKRISNIEIKLNLKI